MAAGVDFLQRASAEGVSGSVYRLAVYELTAVIEDLVASDRRADERLRDMAQQLRRERVPTTLLSPVETAHVLHKAFGTRWRSNLAERARPPPSDDDRPPRIMLHRFRGYAPQACMERVHDALMPILKSRLEEQAALCVEKVIPALNMRTPQTWLTAGRTFKRKFIIHRGPTNSGKTYGAMKDLMSSGRGVFLAPLRMLAWEQHEKMVAGGVKADLVTGQERVISADATHLAATVEMVDSSTTFDMAVIDECQNIADTERGHSWTRWGRPVESRQGVEC
jgi:hypothetical protein